MQLSQYLWCYLFVQRILAVVKEKKNSSMGMGFQLLNSGEGDAFVSAGNSGALVMGSSLIIKRIKGVKRPADHSGE